MELVKSAQSSKVLKTILIIFFGSIALAISVPCVGIILVFTVERNNFAAELDLESIIWFAGTIGYL